MENTIKNNRVSIIGLGYVGLPLALMAEKNGFEVVGIDNDKKKVDLISNKISPFFDEYITKQIVNTKIEMSSDFSKISDSSIIVICVPTPVFEDHMPNLEPVESACEGIAPYLKSGQLVILESTVNPGVCENIVLSILEKGSGLKGGVDFYLAHCPERINPGDKKWNVENIPRVVGSLEARGLEIALNFYRSMITGEVKPMYSLQEAEAVKVVENSFRDVNIAFVNELAMSFSRLGINIVHVIEGAATKPFSFMVHYPGCGVGGHCIPVDPYYLIDYAKKNGFSHDFLKLARNINNHMPEFTIEQTKKALEEIGIPLAGAKVTVLGLSYKPEINDCRESPSFKIISALENNGAIVSSYDPFVPEKSIMKTLYDATTKADAVIIATAHNVFKELKPEFFLENGIKVLVDGRNCLNKEIFVEAGVIYKGIGI